MYKLVTLYAVAAVYVFDRFWPEKSMGNASRVQGQLSHDAQS